jgi:hypothetical protein
MQQFNEHEFLKVQEQLEVKINHASNIVNITVSLLSGLIKMDLLAIILSISYFVILFANKNSKEYILAQIFISIYSIYYNINNLIKII